MKERAEHEIYSIFAIIVLIVTRLILLLLIVYCASAWSENEAVISVFISILALLFLASGIDKIMIYADRFEHVSSSLLPVFQKKKTFYYTDIRNIEVEGNASALLEILTGSVRWNKIYITTHEEELLAISTYLDMNRLQNAATCINDKLALRKHNRSTAKRPG